MLVVLHVDVVGFALTKPTKKYIYFSFCLIKFSQNLGLKCNFEDSLGCLIIILLRVVVQLHSILAGYHDLAMHSPMDFAACSPPIIFTVRTTPSKINYGQP